MIQVYEVHQSTLSNPQGLVALAHFIDEETEVRRDLRTPLLITGIRICTQGSVFPKPTHLITCT